MIFLLWLSYFDNKKQVWGDSLMGERFTPGRRDILSFELLVHGDRKSTLIFSGFVSFLKIIYKQCVHYCLHLKETISPYPPLVVCHC